MLQPLLPATLGVLSLLSSATSTQMAHADTVTDSAYNVGYSQGQIDDPMGGEMRYSIWYPSTDTPGKTRLGPFRFSAKTDASPAKGPFPLVLLSHGSGGNHLGHRNIAISLAKAGIIVAAPSHPRDNSQDQSGVGHRIVWEGRPLQISAVLNDLHRSSDLTAHIDTQRTGIFGFSLGGYTALALLGATPSLEILVTHCQAKSDLDPVCRYGGGLASSMQKILDEEYRSASSPAPRELTDSRFCAAVLVDPLAAVFSDGALNELASIPVRVYLPEFENELAAVFNGSRVAEIIDRRIGAGHGSSQRMTGAHHYTFIAPFPAAIASQLPPEFKDHPALDRAAFDSKFESDVTSFFVDALAECSAL